MTLEIGKTITRSTWLLLLYKTHAFVRQSCKVLTQTQLRAHLAPLLIPSDGKIHSQLPFQLLDAIIPSIHSISPQCLVVIKVWNRANPLLDAFVPFQSSLPKVHSICYIFSWSNQTRKRNTETYLPSSASSPVFFRSWVTYCPDELYCWNFIVQLIINDNNININYIFHAW